MCKYREFLLVFMVLIINFSSVLLFHFMLRLSFIFVGHYTKSALPHCWYTWVVLGLIPVMFFAGLVVQFCKTAKNSDHREGKNG